METVKVNLLSNKAINVLRDTAISLENEDLNIAYEIMLLAHQMRPEGEVLKKNWHNIKLS